MAAWLAMMSVMGAVEAQALFEVEPVDRPVVGKAPLDKVLGV